MVLSSGLRDKLKGLFSRSNNASNGFVSEPVDDFETRDKVVKALRRQRRQQMDIVEKEGLRKSIQDFEIEKGKKDFVGDSGLVGEGVGRRAKKVKNNFFGKGSF